MFTKMKITMFSHIHCKTNNLYNGQNIKGHNYTFKYFGKRDTESMPLGLDNQSKKK